MSKSEKINYSGVTIPSSKIIIYKPMCVYMEIDVHRKKNRIDSINYQQKVYEFETLFKQYAEQNSIQYCNSDTPFLSIRKKLESLYPDFGSSIRSIIREGIRLSGDSGVYIIPYVVFKRVLNFGNVTVPSPYLSSELSINLRIFQNYRVIYYKAYFNDVNDGFPTIYPDGRVTGVKPYFQEAQMKDVIEKSMRDFMKHVKIE